MIILWFSLRGWPGPTYLDGVWSEETVSLVREHSGVHQDGTIGEQSDGLLPDLLLSLLLTLQIINDLRHILGQFSQAETNNLITIRQINLYYWLI